MAPSSTDKDHRRCKLRQRLVRLRERSRSPFRKPTDKNHPRSLQDAQGNLRVPTSLPHLSPSETSTTDQSLLCSTNDTSGTLQLTREDGPAQVRPGSPHWEITTEHSLTKNQSNPDDKFDSVTCSSDLWSAAYREAVENLRDEIDLVILEGKSVTQLFTELEQLEREVAHESAFDRGVKWLRSLQVPLERFKLLLDLATPLANIEPTATTVVGLIKSVTAIAISLATADLDFARQIADMLEKLSYIDDCDTLGQKADRKDIHKALVMVYQKLLEFYKVAYEMLSRRGTKLIIKMVLETDRLPNIVQEFLSYSDTLRNLIQKATWEIVEDIKAMLYDHEISNWLGSGQMSHQSQYHAYLQDLRADAACEQLLENPSFINWYAASDSKQLVILGDMGSGKTVAISYLVDMMRERIRRRLPEPKICYYYCRDDKTGRATHIASALILSLLEQLPGLKRPFYEWYKEAQASGTFDPATSLKMLGEFMERLLKATDRPVFFVIDGLDECDRTSRGGFLHLLEMLSEKVPSLRILLSSRPEQEILEQLGEIAVIELTSNAGRDRVVVEKLVQDQLSYLSVDVKALVQERLSRSAQGSAIWTKMVVELIKVRRIRAADPMQWFLANMPLPRQLSDLYATLFLRCTSDEPENQELASTALKLLAVAYRPLSLLELAWAATLGVAHVTTVDALASLVDYERIISLIYPFIARVDMSDVRRRQVRLVHQSVKEFILEKWTSNPPSAQGTSLTATDQLMTTQRLRTLNAFMLDICIRYLLLDDIGNRDLFSQEQMAIAELPQDVDLFEDKEGPVDYNPYCSWETWEEDMIRYDPTERGFGELFVYASCHWTEHFGAISDEGLPTLASIEDLCQAGSLRLRNWIQQNCRPDCVILPRFEFESSLYDPLNITSLFGSESMLRVVLETSDYGNGKYLQHPAIRAADQILRWGDLSRLRILFFDNRLGPQLQNLEFFRLVIRRWGDRPPTCQNWDLAFDLIEYMPDKSDEEEWRNELLRVAINARCTPMIQRLEKPSHGTNH
ncbi:hypothetical protein AbraIFM66951_002452 [Aspergillus brasiliensis]|uniref:NACHT domain-containing protein n=1 Tax=Aspergillus brasiliensis TaxID=319629 RepID=A0A9W6DR71_9EURO|nr:hypothetical protein AbraCBS73388_001750 [Aspergillus brasiliensis]GKZ49747.1 hypothetical protein AbraIFM66951_002452 [Aspergillus brasiliensis]